MSRLTSYARRQRDRRRKRDRAWRNVMAFLVAHPGPSSYEAFAECQRPRQEWVESRAEMYRPAWETALRRAMPHD